MQKYEDLTGASGREVYFRPERFDPDTVTRGRRLSAAFGGEACRLLDISVSGIGLESVSEPMIGDVRNVTISTVGYPIYSGMAEVRWIEQRRGRWQFGVRLIDQALDIKALRELAKQIEFARVATTGAEGDLGLVPPAYREKITQALYAIRRVQSVLAPLEKGDHAKALASETFMAARDAMTQSYDKLWRDLSPIVETIQRHDPAFMATKRFTEAMLTSELMVSQHWKQPYEKPYGYPGDHVFMASCYEERCFEKTLFGHLNHGAFLHLTECIRNRMTDAAKIIADEERRLRSRAEPFRALNIGCGPSREVVHWLQHADRIGPSVITLLDQDRGALQRASEDLQAGLVRHQHAMSIRYMNASYVDLLKAGRLFDETPMQDIVYSLGVIDYFMQLSVKRMARDLYQKVKPGGLLMLCNVAKGPQSLYWPVEFLLDWELVYRDEADMLDIVDGLPSSETNLFRDATSRILTLTIRKPL